jgi:linoleoyl-CoA desaturase
MKDKHIIIEEDTQLLETICTNVKEQMKINTAEFRMKLLLKFLFYSSLTVFLYTKIYRIEGSVLFLLNYILYGFVMLLFAFNFSHDLSHNTIFKSKDLNNFGFICIYTLVGAHAEAWKHRHIHSHHYAPNVEEHDSDLQITKLIRVIPGSEHKWYHRYQHVYAPLAYMTYSLFWIFIKDFVILFSKDEYTKQKGIKYHLSFWTQKSFYVSLSFAMPLLFSKQSWQIVLIGFLLMHLFQSLFLLFTFFMTHHVESTHYPKTDENGYIDTSWLMNQVKSSNDMHPFSKTANFILGGFNNHVAHHLFPNYHHLHYPELNRILYRVLNEHHIEPNQTTYWGGVLSHLRLLKKMGRPS